jgi:hypothetical protein
MNPTTTTNRKSAATTIKETVMSTAKNTARRTAQAATPTTKAQQERLAAAAKRAADKAQGEADREDLGSKVSDPRTVARAERAQAKADAAKQRANELAEDAGLKLPFPAPRKPRARKAAAPAKGNLTDPTGERRAERKTTARGAAKPAARKTSRTTKVQAKPVESPSAAPTFTSKSKVPTKMGAMLLGLIGAGSTSFFDMGIVEDSDTWHSVLTEEVQGQPGMPKTGKGVANVIDRLVEQGHLKKGHEDEGDIPVFLTKRGAAEARKQAKVLFSVVNTEGTKVDGTPVAKKAATTKAATAKTTPVLDAMSAPKVAALVEFATEQGWAAEGEVDGTSVVLTMTKDAEVFVVSFINGSMDASRMPYMLRSDSSRVLLRNVSAVKANLMSEADATKIGKASLRVKREVVRGSRKVAKAATDVEQPRKALPFDVSKADDDVVLDFLAGSTITWRRTIDNGELSATIGRKVWMAKNNKPGKERIVHFIERVQGKRVHEAGQRSVRLDMIVSVR